MPSSLIKELHDLKSTAEYISNEGFTPYLSISDAANYIPADLMEQYGDEQGQFVLNLSPSACDIFSVADNIIFVVARFNKVSREITIPVREKGFISVLYAREAMTSFMQPFIIQADAVGLKDRIDGVAAPAAPSKPGEVKPKLQVVK